MRRLTAALALAPLALATSIAAQYEGPPPLEDVTAEQATIGALYAAGYEIHSDLQTTPATDAASVRFTFIMHKPENQALPLYMCRMLVGPGEEDAKDPLIIINKCERIR
ncbi:MAG: hypothetical protein AAGC57_07940 [Pseudomonadota bacterium]